MRGSHILLLEEVSARSGVPVEDVRDVYNVLDNLHVIDELAVDQRIKEFNE